MQTAPVHGSSTKDQSIRMKLGTGEACDGRERESSVHEYEGERECVCVRVRERKRERERERERETPHLQMTLHLDHYSRLPQC